MIGEVCSLSKTMEEHSLQSLRAREFTNPLDASYLLEICICVKKCPSLFFSPTAMGDGSSTIYPDTELETTFGSVPTPYGCLPLNSQRSSTQLPKVKNCGRACERHCS